MTLGDLVKETASCSGTSNPYTLLGAEPGGYQTFSSQVANAGTCPYAAKGRTTGAWEVGIGTYTSSGNTLARTTVKASSTGSAINWTAEVIDIYIDLPAFLAAVIGANYPIGMGYVVYTDANGNLTGSVAANISGNTLSVTNLSCSGNISTPVYIFSGLAGVNETNGVYYIGATQENPQQSCSIIDGSTSNPGSPNMWLQKHSTNTPSSLVGSRSNINAATHAPVTNSMSLFQIKGLGSTQSGTPQYEYQVFGMIEFLASASGTISATSSPGAIKLYTTPDTTTTPVLAVTIDQDQSVTFADNIKLPTQTANNVLAGPASGSAAVPTFRALVAADFPAPVDHSADSTDYALAPGEEIVKTFTGVTSVPLYVNTTGGTEYEMSISGDTSVSLGSAGPVWLQPNNSAQTAGSIKHITVFGNTGLSDSGALVTGTFFKDATLYTAFFLTYDLLVSVFARVKTSVKSKIVRTDAAGLRSDGLYAETITDFWNDTTTAWTSLGTLTFPFAQNVTIIIKRIL